MVHPPVNKPAAIGTNAAAVAGGVRHRHKFGADGLFLVAVLWIRAALAALVVVAPILKRRDPQKPQAVLSLLGAAGASVAVGGRKATRAAVHVTLDTGRKVNADTVLLINENNSQDPYRILAWRDDFDGPV